MDCTDSLAGCHAAAHRNVLKNKQLLKKRIQKPLPRRLVAMGSTWIGAVFRRKHYSDVPNILNARLDCLKLD